MAGITQMRRSVKNVACNYSDAQVKVREATSNDPWGPSSTLMAELSDMTYDNLACAEIMSMVWKRLNDSGKNWRHVYKSLVLLDYVIKTGSEKVAQQCKENLFVIQTLKDFQHIEDNKDQGMNVREKAKQLVGLLKDDERLKNERARALMAKKRFAQNSMGISSDGTTQHMRKSDTFQADGDFSGNTVGTRKRRDSEIEGVRPTSAGEEELQLQIALALSKEEAQKEEEMRRGDDIRLAMAITESKTNPPEGSDDLLGLQAAGGSNDAWGASASARPPVNDPWSAEGPGEAIASDPWSPAKPIASPPAAGVSKDPWGLEPPPAYSAVGSDPWSPVETGAKPQNVSADPFAPLNDSSGYNNSDPWGGLNNGLGDGMSNGGLLAQSSQVENARANVKTPENFLGENSALVNLENLMGPSHSVTATSIAPSTNPFLASGPAAPVPATNPFLAQQRPSPTLNQMRQQNTPVADTSQWASNIPEPLQPAKNNPFMG